MSEETTSMRRAEIPVEKRPYGVYFFVFALVLALGTLWAVADEVIVRRPWKDWQRRFNEYEYNMVAARRDSLAAALEQAEQASDPSQTRAGLQQQLEAMRAALADNSQYHALQTELKDRDFDLFKVNREYQFTKSTYDEKFYFYTEAKHAGHDYSDLERETESLKRVMDSLLPIIRVKAAGRDSIQHAIDALEGPIDSLAGLIQGKTQEISKLNERLAAIESRPIKVKQIILPDYEPNEFENPIIRVDRCMTCHVGIDKPEFAGAPQPFAAHPRMDEYFKNHPVEKFGCTPCHDGQGPALTEADAHAPKKYWDHPMLAARMREAGCQKCHQNRIWLDHAEKLTLAQEKVRRWGCFGCHDIEGYNHLAKVAPRLDKVNAKVSAEWMFDWIKNPRHFRPDTRMPNFRMPDSEVVAVTHYLRAVSKDSPGEDWPTYRATGDARRGLELVQSVGCLGCHQIGDLAQRASDVSRASKIDHGPNLSRIGNKVSGTWLYGWLKNPRAYNPDTRMPSLRLTDAEAEDITAYLLTLRDPAYTPTPSPSLSYSADELKRQGEYWIRTYGCFGCHEIPGMEKEGKVSVELTTFGAKDATELAFGDATDLPETWEAWTMGKLTDSRRYETKQVVQRMPDFAMSEEDAQLITMLLRSWDGRKVYEDYREKLDDRRERLEAGRTLIDHYNCTGCHVLEGRGGDIRAYIPDKGYQPPVLTPEGAKVQSDWLFKFLREPYPIRPWLRMRMPTFGLTAAEITAINQYFMAYNGVIAPFHYVKVEDLDPASVRRGKEIFDDLQCLSCHVLSEESLARRGASSLAPNLALAHERLRPDWIIDWLTDPQKIDPGTNMPSFFYSEGERLYDDADEQIRALRDYLLTLKPL
jgi:mono/diheme cytochrome c family protein